MNNSVYIYNIPKKNKIIFIILKLNFFLPITLDFLFGLNIYEFIESSIITIINVIIQYYCQLMTIFINY